MSFPIFKELRLSDSFKTKGNGNLELVANVYNINKGRNAEIASKSPVLSGYNELIAEVNRNRQTMELAEAVETAIKSCVERKILVYFLEKHASEVLNMLFTEWNMDDALAVRYEEGIEDGMEKGRAEGMEKVFSLLEQGVSLTEAKKRLAH
jgi:flagellar biosynthesis/type III secretory pathway protein FliH